MRDQRIFDALRAGDEMALVARLPDQLAGGGEAGLVEHVERDDGSAIVRHLCQPHRSLAAVERDEIDQPVQQHLWSYTQSIRQIGGLMGGRMFPLTLDGLDGAMKALTR